MAGAFEAGRGQRRLEQLADSSDDAVVALDLDGLIQRWNPGAQKLYGHPADAARGRVLTELLDAPPLPSPSHSASVREFTADHHGADGRALAVSGTVWPVSDENGRLTGSVMVTRLSADADDVQRRMQDEALLLREAQDLAGVGTWAWQPGSNTVRWNDVLHRIHGVEPGSFTPSVEEYLSRVHPDDRELALDKITNGLVTGEPFAFDERIVREDGEIRLLHSRGRVVQDPGGTAERMIGISVDITDRVAGEAKLRDLVERLNEAQEIARIGSWEWDISANTLVWSDVLYEIYGIADPDNFEASYDAFIGLVDEGDRELVGSTIRTALEDRRPFAFAHRLVRPDGEQRFLQCRGRVIASPDGRAARMVGTAHDVTEQRAAEQQLADAAAQLELARRLANLLSITEAALSHLALDDLLPELLDRICTALDLDQVAVFLFDEDGESLRLRASRGADGIASETLAAGEGFAGAVIRERRALVLDDSVAIEATAEREHAAGLRSLLGVPLIVDDEPVGALCAGSRSPEGFSDDAGALLRLAADRAAIAIQHGRLYERERRIAETLQRSLLPDVLPTGGSVEVAARYLPASGEVGGDWYDAIPLPGGGLGLALGDVSGHGIRAAALMGELRHSLSAFVHDGRSPTEVAERLDGLIARRGIDAIATLVYVVLEPGGTLHGISAGHLPPLVLGRGARFLPLQHGPPLGCGAVYVEAWGELLRDETLVLYSDGLVERRGEPIDEGLERLRLLAAAAAGDPDAVCEQLVTRLVPRTGGDDDVAVVAARPVLVPDLSAEPRADAPAPPPRASSAAPR